MFVKNQLVRLLVTLLTRIFVQCAESKLTGNQMEQLRTVITGIDERKFIPAIYEIHALIFRAIYCYK